MRLVSFDPFRGSGLANQFIKADAWLAHWPELTAADVILYPESWQVAILHHVLRKPLFPNLASYQLGYDKCLMTRAFQAVCPAHVPETHIVSAGEGTADELIAHLGLPLVLKQPRHSMGRGVMLAESRRQLVDWCAKNPVVYAQEWLPCEADLRVVWVGRQIASAYWRRDGDGFHHNLAQGATVDFDNIPASALNLVSTVATTLGVDHAGFDIIMIDQFPMLLEFNVLFGNQALTAAGIDLKPIIRQYLDDNYSPMAAPPRAA